MKIGRWLMLVIGATAGSLFAVWWIRNRGVPMLPSGMTLDEGGETTDWIKLD
jgi:hypothetical protein